MAWDRSQIEYEIQDLERCIMELKRRCDEEGVSYTTQQMEFDWLEGLLYKAKLNLQEIK